MHDVVAGRLNATFSDLGRLALKNIERPIQAHAVHWRADDWRPDAAIGPSSTTGSGAAQGHALALPDRPSIAVLPFQNMSGDPEQEYFVDGLVEEIITALSRLKWFFVIARNSSFTYKGRPIDVRQVGRELGVRYVLEGSIRKSAKQVRITGQLNDAVTGRHTWADRFDGSLEDVFALQDEVTSRVVAALEPSLRKAEVQRALHRSTESLTAYDLCLRATQELSARREVRASNDEALRLLKAALAIDPGYANAAAQAGLAYLNREVQGWSTAQDDAEGMRLARAALHDHRDEPLTLARAAHALVILGGRHDEALKACDLAMAAAPDVWRVATRNGWVRLLSGEYESGLRSFQRACRLSPLDPSLFVSLTGMSYCQWALGAYPDGLRNARLAVDKGPHWASTYRALILCLVALDRREEARAATDRLLETMPGYRLRDEGTLPYRDATVRARALAALRDAGVPQ